MADNQIAKPKQDNQEPPQETQSLDITQLASMLRERRGGLSIRQAAQMAEVSFSTFARVEGGAQPDLATFSQLCAWLGVSPGHFFTPVASRYESHLEGAVAHLQSDPRLSPEARTKLSAVMKDLYDALAKREIPLGASVACHLRATNVMRPGVPDRLASLLKGMHDEIASQVAAGKL
jgi:transcriptional regulator with XRE-family HTH domain